MSSSRGETGFESYRYKGGDVFYDENCSNTRMYALNTDYLFLRPHKDRNFVTMKERTSVNQDATIVPIFWAGNMTVANRSLQGLILA
jgi:hypothetical protein